MANMPHPDKQAVTYRLHRNLIERVKDIAEQRGETVVTFVARALENELDRAGAETSESS